MNAHWIEHEHLFSGTVYECSNCGNKSDKRYVSCPHCHADMNGKGKYEPDFVEECFIMDMFS